MLIQPIQDAKAHKTVVQKEKSQPVVLGALKPGVQVHFWNNATINFHDVLKDVLKQTGPSQLFISTWSMGAPSVKKLLLLKKEGLITAINAVVDIRTQKDHAEAFTMALRFFDGLAINKSHAKVIAITGGKFTATIFGSANLTRNSKHERLCISTVPEIVQSDIDAIIGLIEGGAKIK